MTELEDELLRAVAGSVLLVYSVGRLGTQTSHTFVKIGGSWVWNPGKPEFQVYPRDTLAKYYENWDWVIM